MARASKKAASAVGNEHQADPRLINIASAPSERWQRGCEYEISSLSAALHGVDAERVQRAHDGVAALARSGRIGFPEVAAATRWTADYERSMRSSYCEPATAGIRGSGTNVGPENRYASGVDASTRHRQAREAVGELGDLLLRAVVGDGRSLRSIAASFAARLAVLNARKAKVAPSVRAALIGGRAKLTSDLADTLSVLAAHYQRCDDEGRGGVLGRPGQPTRKTSTEARLAA